MAKKTKTLSVQEAFAAMTPEEQAEFIAANTPKPVSKRKQQEDAAAEFLEEQLPILQEIFDVPEIPPGFVLEMGRDREGEFFSKTRTIRRKRKSKSK